VSREIDVTGKLSKDDIMYLQNRGRLPEGIKPIDMDQTHIPLSDIPHTGDANTAGLTTAQLEEMLKERRKEEAESLKAGRAAERKSAQEEGVKSSGDEDDDDDDEDDEDDDEEETPRKAQAVKKVAARA